MAKDLHPRRLPKQARSAATVDAILMASRRVLVRDGYAGFTTERVAKLAGVSIGSLYEYFPTKDALLSAIVDGFLESMLSALTASMVVPGTLEETVRRLLTALLDAKAKDAELNAVVLEQLPRVNGAARIDALDRQLEPMFSAFLANFATELPGVDAERAAFVLTYAVQGVVSETVKRRRVADPRMVDDLTALVLGYLRRPSP
jgi:AcrR family transcriptional regulator